MSTVLVTGGSGFIAGHCMLQLLAVGHAVRATLRNPARADEIRATLRKAGAAGADQIGFTTADLSADVGWADAARGCDFVLHVASPFPFGVPKHEDELIVPAREGTLRVLRAARDAGVRRVVLTSSFAAIGYGHPPRTAPFDETCWTNLDAGHVAPYVKSKTLAERAAWDFIAREGGALELAVVNPVGVFGPALGRDLSTSVQTIQRMLDGGMPACPRLYFGVVDVRDVAELHLRAMIDPRARGERFLATAGPGLSLLQIANVLHQRLGAAGRRAPRHQIPDWLVKLLAACGSRLARSALPELGKVKSASNEKARRLLGWQPRSGEEAIAASGESLLQLGLVKVE
ncbi:MAG TPA: aldehyde reductase [Steroidobacteraceae bacterium]|nr:aldehyde reductase [Steroidobacteraceae bacterium]